MDTFKGDETLGGGLDFDLGLVRRDLGDDFDQVFQKAVCRRFLVSDSSFGPTASLLIRSARASAEERGSEGRSRAFPL
jgi:hypothetical protein